jgi:hypothetical protein
MMTAILHFCTNDYRFLQRQIDELSLVCNQVIIPICDHFFNGEKENRELLSHAFQTFPKVQFLLFQYDAKRLYSPLLNRKPEDEDWATLWHSTSRYIGYLFSPPRAKYLLFIDADEIIEAKRFKSWLAKTPLKENAYWFSSYCYTRSAHLRTQTLQNKTLELSQRPEDHTAAYTKKRSSCLALIPTRILPRRAYIHISQKS